MASILGDAARTRRSELGLTQAAVASLAGIQVKTYGELERGVARNFSDLTLTKVSRALDWPANYLSNLRGQTRAGAVDPGRLDALSAEMAALTARLDELAAAQAGPPASPLAAEVIALLGDVDDEDLVVLVQVIRRWLIRRVPPANGTGGAA